MCIRDRRYVVRVFSALCHLAVSLRGIRGCGGRHGLGSRLGLLGLFVFRFLLLLRQGRSSEATALKAKKPLQNEARPRERRDRGHFLPIGKEASSYRGAYRVPLFN